MEKKLLLFIFVCIPIRVSFVYFAKNASQNHLKLMGFISILSSISLMYQFVSKSRTTGIFGTNAWWDSLRPVHSVLYLCFSIMAILSMKNAHIPLAVDVILGFASFIYEYFIKV
jgi:hypothetical protein